MDQAQALELLRGGKDGIREWNAKREAGEAIPDLSGVDLTGADLRHARLDRVIFQDARLAGADLKWAVLNGADLSDAVLVDAVLVDADLCFADLGNADLSAADVTGADLLQTNLNGAKLSEAVLHLARLDNAKLASADFSAAVMMHTVLGDLDLSDALGLESVEFTGPCSIGQDTLALSKGRIPESFLRGCGLQPWEVHSAKLYDPDLTADQITDIQYEIFRLRTVGPIFLGGVFISYSHVDSDFVDKVHDRLGQEGAPVWLDRHDMVAGDMQKQVDRAVRLNDVVLLVLSEASIKSDWVEHELEMAREKEKREGRDVLCPVALDGSWQAKVNDVLWRQIKKKHILDFSKWKTEAFEPQFQKLLKGLKIFYKPTGNSDAAEAGES